MLALQRVEELRRVAAHHVSDDAAPVARTEALARYGLATDVAMLRRLTTDQRSATFVATTQSLLTTRSTMP